MIDAYHSEDVVLSREEVATMLGLGNPRSLSNRISRGLPVPAWCSPPGSKNRIWLTSDVLAFLRSYRIDPNR